jgi:hypothetical protein
VGRGVKLTTHLQPVPRLRIRGSIHPLPHTPSRRSTLIVRDYIMVNGRLILNELKMMRKNRPWPNLELLWYDVGFEVLTAVVFDPEDGGDMFHRNVGGH